MNSVEVATLYVAKSKTAAKAGKTFEMSLSNFANVRKQTHCAYSGLPFTTTGMHTFSFERVDNNLGYVDGNVIPVSKLINSLRSRMETVEEVDDVIAKTQQKLDNQQMIMDQKIERIAEMKKEAALLERPDDGYIKPIIIAGKMGSFMHNLKHRSYQVQAIIDLTRNIEAVRVSIESMQASSKSAKNKANKIISYNNQIDGFKKRMLEAQARVVKYEKRIEGLYSDRVSEYRTDKHLFSDESGSAIHHEINKDILFLEEEIKAIKQSMKNTQRSMDLYPYVRAGIERYSNLSTFDKMTLRVGYPLGTPKARVIKQAMANRLANEVI